MLEGQDAETGALPELAGLEVAEALARLGVDPASYVELLRRFGPQADRDLEVLAAAVSARDAEGHGASPIPSRGRRRISAPRACNALRARSSGGGVRGTDLGALAAEVAREGPDGARLRREPHPPAAPGRGRKTTRPFPPPPTPPRSGPLLAMLLPGVSPRRISSGATAALAAARAAGTPAPLRPVMAQLAQRVKQYEFAEAGAVVGRLLVALAEHPEVQAGVKDLSECRVLIVDDVRANVGSPRRGAQGRPSALGRPRRRDRPAGRGDPPAGSGPPATS